MKPPNTYHAVPHKPNCDCLGCKLFARVQSEAYGVGHQNGYFKGYQEGLHKGAFIPPDAATIKELTA